jgi:hypothetical protein
MQRHGNLWVALLVLLGGCGDDQPPLSSPARPGDLRIVAGNNQSGRPGELLAEPLVVQAVDRRGRPMGGVEVRFEVVAGGGLLSPTQALTGEDGRAQTHLTLGPAGGVNQVVATLAGLGGLPPTFTAMAEAGVLTGSPAPASGRRPDAAHFSLATEKLNLPGGVLFGIENRITAFVFDAQSNPVPAGTLVRFRTSGGGIGATAGTDSSGRAAAILTTAGPVPEDGRVTVSAETAGEGGEVLRAQIQVLFSGATLVRLLQPARFEAAAGQAQELVFFVGDANGHPLSQGSRIQVTATGGTVSGQTDVVLPDTQAPEDTRFSVLFQAAAEGEIPRLSLAVSSPNGDRQLELVSGAQGPGTEGTGQAPVELVVEAADSVLVADGESLTLVTAMLRDSQGIGVPDQVVQFAASTGQIEATALTDAAGRATVTYQSAANPAGVSQVRLEARAGALAGTTVLRLLGVRLSLSASPEGVAADGMAQAAIEAVLRTEEGQAVPFVPVDFAARIGRLSTGRAETDVAGRARVMYTGAASTEDLLDEVRARAAGLVAAVEVRLLGVRLSLTATPDTVAADGNAQATLRVHLSRSDGAALANGLVRLETSLGRLSATEVETDGEGMAEAILVAGIEAGKALVRATYGGAQQQVAVALVKGPPASIVLISVEPPAIGVQGAGGNETAAVTFEVRDERGNRVADGESVLFRLDAPGEGGERVGPERTATVGGRVQAALRSGTRARTVRLIALAPLATGDTIRSTPVPIAIHGGLPDQRHFSLAASPVNLAGRVVLGLESTITAFVFDKFSNPVQPGTSVRFRTDGGGIQGAAETIADSAKARVVLFTAEPMPPGPAFLATITGQTVDEEGREIEAQTTVLFSGPTAPIRLTGAGADTISLGRLFIPDGGNQIVAFAVSDDSGNPLMGGSRIEVTSDVAQVSGDARATVPDARGGHTEFAIVVADPAPSEDPPRVPQRGTVLIQVRSFNGDRQLAFALTVD